MDVMSCERKSDVRALSHRVALVGPTTTSTLAARELKRIAHAWGTLERGWTCYFGPESCVIVAWVGRAVDKYGRPANIVAMAEDVDQRVALRRLLGELMAVDGT